MSLVYAVHLERQGSVSFTYQYPDNNIFFEFYVSLACLLCGVVPVWLLHVLGGRLMMWVLCEGPE